MNTFQKGMTLSTSKLKREQFPLPELDCVIYLRSLSAKELMDWQRRENEIRDAIVSEAKSKGEELSEDEIVLRASSHKDLDGFRLIALSAVDENGNQIFSDVKDSTGNVIKTAAKDVEESLNVSWKSIVEMVKRICTISGMDKIETRQKN